MWRKGTRIGIKGVLGVPECAETICALGTLMILERLRRFQINIILTIPPPLPQEAFQDKWEQMLKEILLENLIKSPSWQGAGF